MSPTLVLFSDLIAEAKSGIFGPNWKVLLEECVSEYCRGRKLRPQTYGFKGHGASGWEWDDSDLQEIAERVFIKDIAPNNQHLAISQKASNVSQVKAMIKRSIAWRMYKDRPRSVNGSVVENLKRMLKEKHSISLSAGDAVPDPKHIEELKELEQIFPTPRWRKEGAVKSDGTPFIRLPKVFKDADLAKVAEKISKMDPLPNSNEIWGVVGKVLGSKEGTQEFNSDLVDTIEEVMREEEAFDSLHTGNTSRRVKPKITGSKQGEAKITGSKEGDGKNTDLSLELFSKLEKLSASERNRFQNLADELVSSLNAGQRKALQMAQDGSLIELSKADIADALGLADENEVGTVLLEVADKTRKFVESAGLDEEEQDLLQRATLASIRPPSNWPTEIEE